MRSSFVENEDHRSDKTQTTTTNQTQTKMTQFTIIGPSDAKYPVSNDRPDPMGLSNAEWHNREIQRLINIWMEKNSNFKVTRVSLRNDTEFPLRLFADVIYEVETI